MHIYFSGIGGTGIGPLALIAHQAGYIVSGSDKQASQYTDYLQKNGVSLHIGQTEEAIAKIHAMQPIDWAVFSSAITIENPDHPEYLFCQSNNIKMTKRDACINMILSEKGLKLIAIAGTDGKTTTTAMTIWALKQLGVAISYSVGAKISFGPMGQYDPNSKYFIYECDEFDRNFLQFDPFISTITKINWDHQEIYPTEQSYKDAFLEFIGKSQKTFIHKKDFDYIGADANEQITVIPEDDHLMQQIKLPGLHNKQNARVCLEAIATITDKSREQIIEALNEYPGSSRRFEKIADNIYSDYAHTPEEVRATIQMALELSQNVIVVYEPLTNRRQHYMKDEYHTVFEGAKHIYWLPSYLAREDPKTPILSPTELISYLSNQQLAQPSEKGPELAQTIRQYANSDNLVLCMAGGGGGSLDEWLREQFGTH